MVSESEPPNPKSPEVHQASDEDILYLPAIEETADTIFIDKGVDALPAAASAEELSDALKVLVIDHPPVGFARVEELDGNAHLEQLSVQPDAMGRGLGTKLLYAASTWAKEQGYSAITLMTFRDIPWNAPYYARHGFEEITNPSDAIQKLIEHEKELGLNKLGARVAMMKRLQ